MHLISTVSMCGSMVLLLLPIALVFASQQGDNTINNPGTITGIGNKTNDGLFVGLKSEIDGGTIIAAIITLVGTVFIGSILSQHYRKRNFYHDPYIQWCVGAYGTIHEFRELCHAVKEKYAGSIAPTSFTPTPMNGHENPSFVISHLWEMHREVEKGYKWLGQIEKQDECAALAFNSLFDDVDNLWHYLEQQHKDLLAPQTTSDNLRKILNNTYGATTTNIATEIIDRIRQNDFAIIDAKDKNDKNCNISSEAFIVIINFLFNKIPKPWYQQNKWRE